jgi:hypothetical protein
MESPDAIWRWVWDSAVRAPIAPQQTKSEIEDVTQERASEAQAGGDVVRAVEVRIHHESLPADGGARFLEINPHDDHNAVGDFAGESGETGGVVAAGVNVVD